MNTHTHTGSAILSSIGSGMPVGLCCIQRCFQGGWSLPGAREGLCLCTQGSTSPPYGLLRSASTKQIRGDCMAQIRVARPGIRSPPNHACRHYVQGGITPTHKLKAGVFLDNKYSMSKPTFNHYSANCGKWDSATQVPQTVVNAQHFPLPSPHCRTLPHRQLNKRGKTTMGICFTEREIEQEEAGEPNKLLKAQNSKQESSNLVLQAQLHLSWGGCETAALGQPKAS